MRSKIVQHIIERICVKYDIPINFHKEERRLLDKYYFEKDCSINNQTYLIVMIDGRTIHNGLSDRFKGICSAYNYAKDKGLIFKLYYTYPFSLNTFLVPNKYNWEIEESNICYSKQYSKPILVNDYEIQDYGLRKNYLDRKIKGLKQVHLYTNSLFGNFDFSKSFNELFKPTELLQNEINYHLNIINSQYISISLRFQRLLGDDFSERNAIVLPKDKAEKLISNVITEIEKLHKSNKNYKIVIFSDSNIFLNHITHILDYVYVIPGKVVHVDNTSDANIQSYLKTFVDFFLISKASKVFLLYNDLLYKSNFPKRAAEINKVPFESIKI